MRAAVWHVQRETPIHQGEAHLSTSLAEFLRLLLATLKLNNSLKRLERVRMLMVVVVMMMMIMLMVMIVLMMMVVVMVQ